MKTIFIDCYMAFKLKSGITVEWQSRDAFSGDRLTIIDGTPTCWNPWTNMNDNEMVTIKASQPGQERPPCDITSLLRTSVLTIETMKEAIEEFIGADCWGVFTTNSDRTSIIKVYFDHRLDRPGYDDITEVRNSLMTDATELVDTVKANQTVVIVLGGLPFHEIYFSKLENIYVQSDVDHSIQWSRQAQLKDIQ